MLKTIKNLFDVKFTHHSLSIVRFSFFVTAAIEFFQLYVYRGVSYTDAHFWVSDIILPLSIINMLIVAVGYKTRFFLITNLILVKIVLNTVLDHYHIDYAIENVSLIFLFSPSPRALSVDSYLNKISEVTYVPVWFSIYLFLGLELVYFDSLFYKFNSTLWMDGLAFWLPAALPHFSTGLLPEMFEIEWLMRGFSYLSFTLEILFPLILIKKLRIPVLFVALTLHFGISVFFPIPWFGLIMCALLLYFFKWEKLFYKNKTIEAKAPKKNLKLAFLGYSLCILMFLSQAGLIVQIWYRDTFKPIAKVLALNFKYISKEQGLYSHGVYVDFHFLFKNPILRYTTVIDGKEFLIPSFDLNGYPSYPEITGRYWVYTLFLKRGQLKYNALPTDRMYRFVKDWFDRNDYEYQPVKVYYKDVQIELKLDFEYDNIIRENPWKYGGEFTILENGEVEAEWTKEFLVKRKDTRKKSDLIEKDAFTSDKKSKAFTQDIKTNQIFIDDQEYKLAQDLIIGEFSYGVQHKKFLSIAGWALNANKKKPVDKICLIFQDKTIDCRKPNKPREDVGRVHQTASYRNLGYAFLLEMPEFKETLDQWIDKNFKIVAITKKGKLSFLKSN